MAGVAKEQRTGKDFVGKGPRGFSEGVICNVCLKVCQMDIRTRKEVNAERPTCSRHQ